MRASNTLFPTLRDDPADADVVSHKLLLRAGFLRQLGGGLFTWLPLGLRVLHKVEAIVRKELNRHGAQEVLMPIVQPADLWRESGRWDVMGQELLRIKDRHERDYCFSPTHEEVVTDLLRKTLTSYRQLPCNVYQIYTKFRDEIRPRFGLMRAREFIMKDGYSFHLDPESLDTTYRSMRDAYTAILERIGLQYRAVEADSGIMGGSDSEEFHVLAESGEDAIAYSTESDYAANVEKAEAVSIGSRTEPTESIERVATPDVRTIAEVAEYLNCEPSRTVKTLVVHGEESLVGLVLRGDHTLSATKTQSLKEIKAPLTFATDDEIRRETGVAPGSIGPIGLGLPVLIDRAAAQLTDFVCGANVDEFHYRGVNWDRDVALGTVVDLRNVEAGDPSPDGRGTLRILRGIEVGHIFKLGTKYSEALNLNIQGPDGDVITPIMGCYGLGVSRLVAAIVEQCHTERGIEWPHAVAPATVHLVPLDYQRSERVRQVCDQLYDTCLKNGTEVFVDDRNERPGVKFTDADLIGIPHRIVIGERGLKNDEVEYRYRNNEVRMLDPADIAIMGLV